MYGSRHEWHSLLLPGSLKPQEAVRVEVSIIILIFRFIASILL